MSKRHPSELVVLDSIGRRRNRTPRTIRALPQSPVDTRIPPVRLLNILLSVAFLEVVVIVWALHELGVIHV
jgi:hypothetical protein